MKKLFLFIFLLLFVQNSSPLLVQINFGPDYNAVGVNKIGIPVNINTYKPVFDPFNTKELMTLSPMFTPDNALDLYVFWINKANSTLNIQNPYFRQFNSSSWSTDSSPIVKAVVEAKSRGVTIKVQINLDSDSDNVAGYFTNLGIEVRGMGNSDSNSGDSYMSNTHNKLVVIDGKVVIISSINFSENAFKNNREAGMVIENTNVADNFNQVFIADWNDGENPPLNKNIILINNKPLILQPRLKITQSPSHTSIPRTNFTGVYNVTVFTNPDNADQVIFDYLNSAKESIYVSMYTISRPEFNNTLINLKKANPSLDIQVLISKRRVSSGENEDTFNAAQSLVDNLIPVYNSTTDDDKVDGFYHNKYWIIDGKHVFIYSGNWSPNSVSPQLEPGDDTYRSSEANRDMGIAVHDASDIADFFLNEVWKKDVAVGDAWELSSGVKITNINQGDVLSGNISIQGIVSGLTSPSLFYSWNDEAYIEIDYLASSNSWDTSVETTLLSNGVNTLKVKVTSLTNQEFFDNIKITVANYASSNNWRVLITEVLSNPAIVEDKEGEFYEITNSFPFAVLLDGWTTGDDKDFLTFPDNYLIDSYSSIIIARNKIGFEGAYSVTADFELGIALHNDNDYVYLKNSNNEFIDVVAYGVDAPDSSESLTPADSGESLQRKKLHIDTDTADDFEIAEPTPKADVPTTPLLLEDESEEEVFFPFFESFFSIMVLIFIKKSPKRN